jgi:hypothetical protein
MLVLGLISLGIPSLTYGMEPSAEEDKRHPSISRAFSQTSYAGSEEEDTDHCCNRCCSIVCSKKGVIFMGGMSRCSPHWRDWVGSIFPFLLWDTSSVGLIGIRKNKTGLE